MEVGGIESPTRVVAQGLTSHYDQIVTVFLEPKIHDPDEGVRAARRNELYAKKM